MPNFTPRILPILLSLFFFACTTPTVATGPEDEESSAAEDTARVAEVAVKVDELNQKAAQHYERRMDIADLEGAISSWEEALQHLEGAQDRTRAKKIKESLARAYYFRARYHHSLATMPPKERIFADTIRGSELARKAIAIDSPDLGQNLPSLARGERSFAGSSDFADLTSDGHPAFLTYLQNLVLYAETRGVATDLELRPLIDQGFTFLHSSAGDLSFGAPARYFGARQVERPFGKNVEASREAFDEALQLAPGFLLTRVLRANTLARATGDRALFESDLQQVLDASPDALPEAEPENLFAQFMARALLSQVEQLF